MVVLCHHTHGQGLQEKQSCNQSGKVDGFKQTISGFISFSSLVSDVCVGMKAAQIRFTVKITYLVLLNIK